MTPLLETAIVVVLLLGAGYYLGWQLLLKLRRMKSSSPAQGSSMCGGCSGCDLSSDPNSCVVPETKDPRKP